MKNQPKLFTSLKVLVMMILLISSQLFAQENNQSKTNSQKDIHEKTIKGNPLPSPTNLQVTLINDITMQVDITWQCEDGYMYFIVFRNDIMLGTTTEFFYGDVLPAYGETCYTVVAVYVEGQSDPAGPECIFWPNPIMNIDPYTLYGEVWVDYQITLYTEISNTGIGTLTFEFPDYVGDRFDCDYQVALYDSYGDGWTGGTLSVYVNGIIVLNNITLASGSGPEYFTFSVSTGDEITTTYVGGSWPYENSYEIINSDGTVVATDGAGGVTPIGIPAGTLFGACPTPSFISSVVPSQGSIAEGESQTIAITYDATDFTPGLYNEYLFINSNDVNRLEDSIYCEMSAYLPGYLEGYVTGGYSGNFLSDVCVVIGTQSALTDTNGYYSIPLDVGTYDAKFTAVRYQDSLVTGLVITTGNTTWIDIVLIGVVNSPEWVTAIPDSIIGYCYIEWNLIAIPYEIINDDGSPDDYFVWMTPDNINAVKFTPNSYPATVLGGKVNVGDGSFPVGANFIGKTFEMAVFDDDGTNGLPGTKLDSVIVSVNNYGWVNFDSLSAVITEGEFYIGMIQLENSPNAAPIAVDYTTPTYYNSYSYDVNAGIWTTSAYQDFMIRAILTKQGDSTNTWYTIARYHDFDPDSSIFTGIESVLQTGIEDNTYWDAAYGGLDEGCYGYGIKALYTSGEESEYTPSNIVCHNMGIAVTINVTTTTGENAEGSDILLTGSEYPYEIHNAILDTSQTVIFDTVFKGLYNVGINKVGYYIYNEDINFINDTTIDVLLAEKSYSPYNLYVDSLTSIATWHEPRITQLREDFEGATFPPEGWQATSAAGGWFATTNGSSGGWTIPPWDSQYACSSSDLGGSGPFANLDYLITPQLDLRESPDFSLKFNSYYDGGYGQSAYVEYSYNAGNTWELLNELEPSISWEDIEVDLSAFSGNNGVPEIWLAFHADDHSSWASGWAIDNVEVSVGSNSDWPPLGYNVYLDDVLVASTNEQTYTYLDLTYGQTYVASVSALYTSGQSEKDYYTFTSSWLYPPTNLHGESFDNAVKLIWYPPCSIGKSRTDETQILPENTDGGGCVVPDNFLGYNVYRDSIFVEYIEYNEEDSVIWFDYNMQPGSYSYTVGAEYDVTVYGGTGTAESIQAGPEIVIVSYGDSIPFMEDWSSGSFEPQQWTVEGENWFIDGAVGNPEPTAEFQWGPVVTNYNFGIISYPILGSEIIDQDIFLEYDYMLDDRNSSGLEFMTVKIWENGVWHEVANYANEGDIEWTTELIDISAIAQGNDFKIGFFANGANSVNFKSWFIDNINVYSLCEVPTNLVYEEIYHNDYLEVLLSWQLGEPPIEEWIQYDDGTNTGNAIGLEGGGGFEVSTYWPGYTMTQYIGTNLTEVEVFINDPTTTAIIKIYGEGTTTEPGDLLAEKTFDGTASSWITVVLDSPVPITGEDIWIGYYGDAPASSSYFAGCDAGPAVAGFGDMISMDGITFESMANAYGLNYNWNIHGLLTNAFGETINIKPKEILALNFTGGNPEVSEKKSKQNVAPYKHRDFVSFSIYRGFPPNYELIKEGLTDYSYVDNISWYPGIGYYYYVIAIYDQCISNPSNEVFVEYPISIDEINSDNSIQIFPNPTVNNVNINSKVNINKITVFDDLGKLVFEKKVVEDNNIKINTSSFDNGVYFFKIFTDKGIIIRKVAVIK